ncbi:MAG: NAD(+)/NADH kinase [Armatimonadetes bacterium]|nr:NAD(+)/NADH kinase [Armatimonadota bacterium]
MRVNLLVNLYRPDAIRAAKSTAEWLRSRGVTVGSDREGAASLGVESLAPDELAHADLMITFGGDGTLIHAAHICAAEGTPVLGVYYGQFGFVTQVEPEETGAALSQFMDGQASIDERMMIQTDLIREDKVVATLHSLNESAVQRSATTRMLTFDTRVNGRLLARYPADGVMVSTPTGSTAYALSAGGPVVDPSMEAILITAIMPHTLSARPLVLRSDSLIEIRVETRGDAVLSCDGQSRLHLLSGDLVRVTKSPRKTRLVSVDEQDFLEKLSDRLRWSQGRREDDF